MMNQEVLQLIGFATVSLIVVGGLAFLSQHYTLDNIKSRTVGDGQYGTARWATEQEIRKTYHHVPFRPDCWRKGISLSPLRSRKSSRSTVLAWCFCSSLNRIYSFMIISPLKEKAPTLQMENGRFQIERKLSWDLFCP